VGAVSHRRRVPDEPGVLWCLGPCGRALPPELFPRSRRGNADSQCRACKRYLDRGRTRARYRRSKAYRDRKLAANRARYAAAREARRAYRRAYYQAHRAQAIAADRRRRLAKARAKRAA
jgi:hypothetical protein